MGLQASVASTALLPLLHNRVGVHLRETHPSLGLLDLIEKNQTVPSGALTVTVTWKVSAPPATLNKCPIQGHKAPESQQAEETRPLARNGSELLIGQRSHTLRDSKAGPAYGFRRMPSVS